MTNDNLDFEREVQRFLMRVRQTLAGKKFNPLYLIGAVLLLWMATGIYVVGPDEAGVVLRFGKAMYTTESGPHWHLPWPVESAYKVEVTQVRKVEVGFRTVSVGPPAQYRDVSDESLMLTGDENIVSLEFIVQYKVKDPIAYLFNVRDPEGTLRDAAESAMRETVGKREINDALTTGKGLIQGEMELLLQEILDSYKVGLHVITVKLQDVGPPNEVNDAFKDVINAQQDKERAINEALGYRNDLIPKARGVAAQTINEAEAYKEVTMRNAEGETERFLQLYEEYRGAKAVTRKRLYLETMEKILPKANVIILNDKSADGLLPYLPVNELGGRAAKARKGGNQ